MLFVRGYTPNTDGFGLELAGIGVASHGYAGICTYEWEVRAVH